MEDNKIIDLFFDRSEQAIVELSIKYGNLCKKISENILNNFADAEECVNDTYLAVWNNIPPTLNTMPHSARTISTPVLSLSAQQGRSWQSCKSRISRILR